MNHRSPDSPPSKAGYRPARGSALLALAMAAALSTGAAPAMAKPLAEHPAAPAKKKTANKVTYQRSASEETQAQRDRRLFRECKGMHNAGACRGYTR